MLMGEGGEALSVIDPTEAWMFHILPDDTGASAVWCAQRIPDTHISIVANAFIIRHVDPNNKKDFMFSANMWEVAERQGWWSRDNNELLDFKLTFAPPRYRPDYSNRRVWRVLSLAAPSLMLPIETNPSADDYPFSVAVDHLISAQELMQYQRDHYEGTKYSTTEGLAAGD